MGALKRVAKHLGFGDARWICHSKEGIMNCMPEYEAGRCRISGRGWWLNVLSAHVYWETAFALNFEVTPTVLRAAECLLCASYDSELMFVTGMAATLG